MSRDETGINIPQATCGDFLEILWSAGDFDQLRLDPDQALAFIREAIRQDLTGDAHDRIVHELTLVGPALTYLRYLTPEERAVSPQLQLMLRYACELSTIAGKMELDDGNWESAREHLLRAIVAIPDNALPRAHLIELYIGTKAYRAARELLEEVTWGPSLCPELFNLGVDILREGECEEARHCFRRVVHRDDVGTCEVLASLMLERTTNGTPSPPSPQLLDDRLNSGLESLRRGDRAKTLDDLHEHLAWLPRSELGWLYLGLAYQIGIDKSKDKELGPNVMSEEREAELERAQEALWVASYLQPQLGEAHLALSSVRLELGLTGPALEAARAAMRFAVEDPTYLGPLSQVLMQNGQVQEAIHVANAALQLDPNEPAARNTIANLEQLTGKARIVEP